MPRSRSTAIQSGRTRRRATRLYFTREPDRAAKQEKFLRERGFTGVRMSCIIPAGYSDGQSFDDGERNRWSRRSTVPLRSHDVS
jgi:hypothetical protein